MGKSYWQVVWVKYPSYNESERSFLGSIVVDWEGDSVPDWETFRIALFPVSTSEGVELLNPQRFRSTIDDATRSEKSRLATDTYKVWVVGNYSDTNLAVPEDHDEF